MQKEGYTIFTGPLKNGPKSTQNKQNLEPLKKITYSNKHIIDNIKMNKLLNDEQQHKIQHMPQDLRIAIIQARNQKGYNQQKLAQLLNVTKSDVTNWENGKVLPSGNMIAKIDKILNVKLPRPQKN